MPTRNGGHFHIGRLFERPCYTGSILDPELIRAALTRQTGPATPFHGLDQAAVALVIAGDDRICLIRRAEFAGDPWSGHMALPGGRASPEDLDARSVAEREAWEEVGLILPGEVFLGALAELPVRRRGLETNLVLAPFAYHLGPELPALTPSDEVAEAYWVRWEDLWDPASQTAEGVRFGEQVIWGLTLLVLKQFRAAITAS